MMNYADLIGIPFEYGGRGPEKYDCWGLLKVLMWENHQIDIPDYKSSRHLALVERVMDANMHLWRPCAERPGSTLLLRVLNYKAHVGYQIDPYRFIHTWEESGGVIIEPLHDWKRAKKVIGSYEYVGSGR
jgi:hypothetical protein